MNVFTQNFLSLQAQNMLESVTRLSSILMNLDNSSKKVYGESATFSPLYGYVPSVYIPSKGVDRFFVVNLGSREPISMMKR